MEVGERSCFRRFYNVHVVRHPKKHPTHIQVHMTLPMLPALFLAHLQSIQIPTENLAQEEKLKECNLLHFYFLITCDIPCLFRKQR